MAKGLCDNCLWRGQCQFDRDQENTYVYDCTDMKGGLLSYKPKKIFP